MKEIAQDVERAEKGKQSIKKAASTPNTRQMVSGCFVIHIDRCVYFYTGEEKEFDYRD